MAEKKNNSNTNRLKAYWDKKIQEDWGNAFLQWTGGTWTKENWVKKEMLSKRKKEGGKSGQRSN